MGELAVRLGAINTFDRTGTVLYYDDFRAGLTNWEVGGFPVTAYPVPTARFHSINPYSIKLATTIDAGSYSSIQRGLPIPYVSRMGWEFHFKQIANIDYLIAYLYVYDGTYRHQARWYINQSGNAIQIIDGLNAYRTIRAYDLSQVSYSQFHVFKLVFDFNTGYYYRALIDDVDYDISSYTTRKSASATAPMMYLWFDLVSTGTHVISCYIDNVIITIDEPR